MNMLCLSSYLGHLLFLSSAFCSFQYTYPICMLLDLYVSIFMGEPTSTVAPSDSTSYVYAFV